MLNIGNHRLGQVLGLDPVGTFFPPRVWVGFFQVFLVSSHFLRACRFGELETKLCECECE